jgi:putative ATP-dependent endonuclease of OLD family
MFVKTVHLQNFRSVREAELHCNPLTALVGRNGVGKSTFLRALELFFDASARPDEADFYNRDTSLTIVVRLRFGSLSQAARDDFQAYVVDDELTVERCFAWGGSSSSSTTYGYRPAYPGFTAIRTMAPAKAQKERYQELQQTLTGLPDWKNQGGALEAMLAWEAKNRASCEVLPDDGKGITVCGGPHSLDRHICFASVPAIQDSAEATGERRGSALDTLLEHLVRRTAATKANYLQESEEIQARYRAMMAADKWPELQALEDSITATLEGLAHGSRLCVGWQPPSDLPIPMPRARVRLVEDAFEAEVDRTGHGLQRALLISLLQHLAKVTPAVEGGAPVPNLFLAIEEPELFQHPSRQRHFAKVLDALAVGGSAGVAERVQVLLCTHSPLLVSLDKTDNIRLLRKGAGEDGGPRSTMIASVDLDEVAAKLWEWSGSTKEMFTAATLRPRLQALATPAIDEGFFADVVVLVEGDDDRAAIEGCAMALGHDFDALGISVIPCGGKSSIDRPATIFRSLGIPVFAVWDGDKDKEGSDQGPRSARDNKLLLRVMGADPVDYPDTIVTQLYCCFETKLERTLDEELGPEARRQAHTKAREKFGITSAKNARVFQLAVALAAEQGKTSPTLTSLIAAVVALRGADEE